MLILLEIANNVKLYKKYAIAPENMGYRSNFKLIEEARTADVKAVELPDMRVISLASRISNLEPSITLSSGQAISLQAIRERTEYKETELKFVSMKLAETVSSVISEDPELLQKAVLHLMTGNQMSLDLATVKNIMYSTYLHLNTANCLSVLIGYTLAFKLSSVSDLGKHFNFHYCDQRRNAKAHGVAQYSYMGAVTQVVCN